MITEVEEEDTHTEKDRKNKKRTCWWRVLLEQLPTRWDAATRKRCHFGARLPAFRFPALSTDWFPLLILGVDSLLFFYFFFFFQFFSFFFVYSLCLFMNRCWFIGSSGSRCHLTYPGFSSDWLIDLIYLLFISCGWFFLSNVEEQSVIFHVLNARRDVPIDLHAQSVSLKFTCKCVPSSKLLTD